MDMGPSGAGNARAPHPHPDFPGYGRRTNEAWPGIAGAAADIAELIRTHAIDGKAHVVGLSLGGFISVELLRHYPQLVRSCAISGSAVSGYARWERALMRPSAVADHALALSGSSPRIRNRRGREGTVRSHHKQSEPRNEHAPG